jgi:hypothetical protein
MNLCFLFVSFFIIYIKSHYNNISLCIVNIYSPTKVKHHRTCFNNIFSNNELISNRFAVFVTCSVHTYLLTCETGY